ncbi:MAG: hypothetical protein GWO24_09080, partial [Akkermansiaceae bacterium]|nr:hypothetical protein [Akkermansiaceae bacterium]
QLRARTALVTLEGNNISFRDSNLGHTFGGGIQAGNTDVVIENNVIRRCQEFGIGTWGGHLNT